VERTRIDAIIVAHRYSAKNRAVFAVSFFAGLRPHLICTQPSSLTPFFAAQRRHVNLSKYTTNGNGPAKLDSVLRCIQPERMETRMTKRRNFTDDLVNRYAGPRLCGLLEPQPRPNWATCLSEAYTAPQGHSGRCLSHGCLSLAIASYRLRTPTPP
jgi:hypothetical protein